jgi:hypothetical protein
VRTREAVEDAIVQAVVALGGSPRIKMDDTIASVRVHGGVLDIGIRWADWVEETSHEAPTVPSRHHDGPADKLTGLHPPCRNPATGRCFCGESM